MTTTTRCGFVAPMRGLQGGTRCPNTAVGPHVSRSDATTSMIDRDKVFCARHLATMRRRDDKALAPHVHKAWMRGVRVLDDGTVIRFCADCGASF